jgi:hypothetical protein
MKGGTMHNQSGLFTKRFFFRIPKLQLIALPGRDIKFTKMLTATGGFFGSVRIRKAWVRKSLSKSKISEWKRFKQPVGEASFFALPDGRKVVIKPCLYHSVPKIFRILVKLIRKRVRFEEPLGIIESQGGKLYLISRFIEGKPLKEWLRTAKPKEKLLIVQSMGIQLADFHSKGFLHGHPHRENWIVNGVQVKMIDPTEIRTKEEWVQEKKPLSWWNHLQEKEAEGVEMDLEVGSIEANIFIEAYKKTKEQLQKK